MKTIPQGAPYRRTVHTWACQKGHTITIDDKGWPQQRGLKEAILKAFQKERCGACGTALVYSKTEEDAPQPVAPPAPPVDTSFQRFAREFNAMPCSPGGAVEARLKAGSKKAS